MKVRMLTVAVLLLSGAVLNVAVAWVAALVDARSHTQPYFFDDGSKRWGAMHTTGLGIEEYHIFFDAEGFFHDRQASLGYGAVPHWARWRGAPGQNWVEFVRAAGWPFRCVLCGAVQPANPAPGAPLVTKWGGLPLRPSSRLVFQGVLPLVPLWKGIITGTVFYTALLWALVFGRFIVRRLLRRWRGLCPYCAYPVAQSAVCTECGEPPREADRRLTIR